MDHAKHYRALISRRKDNVLSGEYFEKHHIMPRSLGGSDDPSNIVRLTAREHFVAHLLLAKIHGGPMWAALAYMANGSTKSAKGVRVGARLYESIRKHDAEWRRERYTGEGNPFFGKTFTPEQLEKLKGPRPSISGELHPNYGKKMPTLGIINSAIQRYTSKNRFEVDTTLQDFIDKSLRIYERRNAWGCIWRYKPEELLKLSQWYRGQNLAAHARVRDKNGENNPNYANGQAVSGEKNPMWGKHHKQSTKDKISVTARIRVTCPHCGKDGNRANMARWHFDNCKLKPA